MSGSTIINTIPRATHSTHALDPRDKSFHAESETRYAPVRVIFFPLPRASGIYAPRVRADPAATLACGTQRTPLGRTCSQRTASGTFPH